MSEQPTPAPTAGPGPDPPAPDGAADKLRASLVTKLENAPRPPPGAPPVLRPGGPVAAVVREKKKWATVQADPVPMQDDRKERLATVDRLLRDCVKSARQAAVAQTRQSGLPTDIGDVRWLLPSRETVAAWLADEVTRLAKS
jgi:hypothetical protein